MSQFLYLSTLPTAGGSVSTGFKALNLSNTYGLNVSVKTDVPGTLNIYWSNDASGSPIAGTDTDTITAFDHLKQYKVKGKYVNLEFTNDSGAVNNTIFNLKASIISENIVSNLPVDVNVISSIGGDATAANQLINHTKLDTINTTLSGTLVVDGSASTQPISATTLPLPTGAASEITLDAVKTAVEGTLAVDGSGYTQPVSATALPLPTGAATEITLDAIKTAVEGTLVVDGSASTQPISATSLPLPTGAASESTLLTIATDVATLAGTVNANGEQKVSVSAENIGTHNNVANNITLNAGATTTAISIAEIADGSLFYEDSLTSSFDGLEIQVSVDNSNWYRWGTLLPYQEPGSSVRTANVLGGSAHGLRYLRLKNISATDNYTNVNATIAGSH